MKTDDFGEIVVQVKKEGNQFRSYIVGKYSTGKVMGVLKGEKLFDTRLEARNNAKRDVHRLIREGASND